MGERYDVTAGSVAHGGHVIARVPTGDTRDDGTPELRVVFVRHALPGERVTVEITEGTDGDRFWRGDAVEVLEASADRVEAPCPFSGPGACGG
ncbi:MAG: TRAM domain-containing protein, partial [Nocardioides sp.]